MSLRFQADNDLKLAIVKAVRRQEPSIDFASAQEAGLDGLGDPELLDRAVAEGRVLVSHDRRTMLNHFRNHLAAGKSSPGLLVVAQGTAIGVAAEAIVTMWAVNLRTRPIISRLSSITAFRDDYPVSPNRLSQHGGTSIPQADTIKAAIEKGEGIGIVLGILKAVGD